jgi:hypothetical protein
MLYSLLRFIFQAEVQFSAPLLSFLTAGEMKRSIRLAAGDCFIDCQQNYGSDQAYQNRGKRNGIVDRPNTHQGANKSPSQEGADNAYHDIEQRTLLRICIHDPTRNITDDGTHNEVYDEVHFFFSFLNVSNSRFSVFGC